MTVMIFCNNKGCGKESPAELDFIKDKQPEDCEVICLECDKPISTVNKFTKRNLFFQKQLRKTSKPNEAFAVKCGKCQNSRKPEIINKKILCSHCKEELTEITPFYKNLLLQKSSGR